MSIKNDGHYFCRAGGNRPDGLNEPVTIIVDMIFIINHTIIPDMIFTYTEINQFIYDLIGTVAKLA
ncbi:hypothetical protein AAAA53_23395, partial [Escherichia coli]|uniref:hypothetical protein n=1 Tax=Escherichia coli TaxID=562 RepID=UPI0034D98448